jgi:hypothetical protein
MMLEGDKIKAVLNKVRIVREHLARHCPAPQGLVLSVMDLHWAIEEVYGLKVEMVEVSFAGEHFVGTVERYADNRARILVKSEQSEAFRRFVAVKELAHLIIDESDDWSTLGSDTVNHLMTEWKLVASNGYGHDEPSNPLQSEFLAEIAATELMYPFCYRDSDAKKLELLETNVTKIALQHEAPAYAIDQALRHHDVLTAVWGAINDAQAKAA